jgi:signal transduction histidine kinase
MIKNYLDLSRLEKGEFNVNKRGVILHDEVLRPLIEELQPEIQQKKMKVDNHIPREMELYADNDLLMIVYDNLLSNAIKYGREAGTIILDAHEDKGEFTMSVCNEGQGIPREKMSALFKKFSRINTPEYAGKKGTGLGLYVCKEIIEKQGGKIWAESEEGKWARFTFALPKK